MWWHARLTLRCRLGANAAYQPWAPPASPSLLHPAAAAAAAAADAAAAEAAQLKELVQQLQEQLSMKDKQLEGLQAAVHVQKAALKAAYARISESMVKA